MLSIHHVLRKKLLAQLLKCLSQSFTQNSAVCKILGKIHFQVSFTNELHFKHWHSLKTGRKIPDSTYDGVFNHEDKKEANVLGTRLLPVHKVGFGALGFPWKKLGG